MWSCLKSTTGFLVALYPMIECPSLIQFAKYMRYLKHKTWRKFGVTSVAILFIKYYVITNENWKEIVDKEVGMTSKQYFRYKNKFVSLFKFIICF